VHTVGAGGGSIAFVNEGGLLQVGPKSAGAMPGPICYGRGGSEPTITDANVLLGRINPDGLLSVGQKVPTAQLAEIFEAKIGRALGLDAVQAAYAIVRIANDTMAGAIRMVSLARGHDPRDFALFPFGGAGPLHACALARELHIPRLLIPARPGITNALGCALSDLRHDTVNALNTPLSTLLIEDLHALFKAQFAQGQAQVNASGVTVARVYARYALDMQFSGQSHVLRVAVEDPTLSKETLATLFAQAYWQRFHVTLPEMHAMLVNVHTAVIGERPGWNLAALASKVPTAQIADAKSGTREVYFENGFCETPIYTKEKVPAGQVLAGPAVIEQMDSTLLIEPGWTASVDALGNVLVWHGVAP
jgi:N-methylhydantoinase A